MSEAVSLVLETSSAMSARDSGLNAFYGSAQALEDVSFVDGPRVDRDRRSKRHGEDDAVQRDHGHHAASRSRVDPVRRGASSSASRRTRSRDAGSATCRRVAGCFRRSPSTSTCKIAAAGRRVERGSEWTRERVYELFPRLAERKGNGGAQLSGGEQQMLAIGRALVTNPKILVMDEPSEGLAPAVIEGLIETFKRLEEEGLAILLIEQNLGVATALAERQLVMIGGENRRRDDGRPSSARTPTSSVATSASSRSLRH